MCLTLSGDWVKNGNRQCTCGHGSFQWDKCAAALDPCQRARSTLLVGVDCASCTTPHQDGSTALDLAQAAGHADIVSLLKAFGGRKPAEGSEARELVLGKRPFVALDDD